MRIVVLCSVIQSLSFTNEYDKVRPYIYNVIDTIYNLTIL